MDAVLIAEQMFAIRLKRVNADEWRSLSGCPFCGDGGKGSASDRFRVFTAGKPRYWCRQCGQQGFLDAARQLTEAEKLEARLRAIEAKQAEQERRLTALEKMHACTDHLAYHRAAYHHEAALDYWFGEGMTSESIDHYQLGYCHRCPMDWIREDGKPLYRGAPSYTIPMVSNGKLWNIRHRLIGTGGDKYRPHMKGLPVVLFNADFLRDASPERILIVEGEKKSIIAAQSGFPNVGIVGKDTFDPAWTQKFERFQRVYVALDPDATERASEIAALFERRGRMVKLPEKLDDLIVKYSAGAADIEAFIRQARQV